MPTEPTAKSVAIAPMTRMGMYAFIPPPLPRRAVDVSYDTA
jgi:hypothetical protein